MTRSGHDGASFMSVTIGDETMASIADERLYEILPNGLHDADLLSFMMNYTQRQLTLDVVAWVSEGEPRELYRPARVTYGDVAFICVEPPRDRSALDLAQSVWIDAGIFDAKDERVAELDAAGPVNYIFLRDFNSFIFFSAGSVVIEWTGPQEVRS